MIVRTRGGGRREYRANVPGASDYIPRPSEYGSWVSSAGQPVTVERASGVPAALNAIALIAETVGGLPIRVYTGWGADKTTVDTSWQWERLHNEPNPDTTPFDFWHDVASCVEARGNAYIFKVKGRTQVDAMYVLDPSKIRVKRDRDNGEKLFVFMGSAGQREFTASEVLHIRGLVIGTGDVGITPIQWARDAFATAAESYTHEGQLYENDGTPTAVIQHPGNMAPRQALEYMQTWNRVHTSKNRGTPGLLTGGASLERIGLTMEDAQFIESRTFSVKDIARAFRLPPSALGADAPSDNVEQETTKLLSFGINMRLKRIEQALKSDPDLFPKGAAEYPQFHTEDLIRVDAATRAEVRHKNVQGGYLLPDEARADMGLPPLPNGIGQIPQITPVGGAPNPGASNGNGQQPAAA